MTVRLAIVGCGGIAKGAHVEALKKVPDAEIVAVCDVVKERAEALAEDLGCAAYQRVEELLDRENVDAVDVATNEMTRFDPALAVIRAKKHLICEKPLIASRGQFRVIPEDVGPARQLVEEASKNNLLFGMNFNYRFAVHTGHVRRLLDTEKLGELVYCRICTHLACWSHVLDLMRYFCGDLAEIFARESPEREENGMPVTDRFAVVTFKSGAHGTIIGNTRWGWCHPLLALELCGTEGRVIMEDLAGPTTFYSNRGHVERWEPAMEAPRNDFQIAFDGSFANFLAAVRDGKPPFVTGKDGLKELEIEAAFVESARTGCAVMF
ncbi:MAG: Gfo/Idh/MocA family oxidoreductase [bacterium]